MTMRRLIATTLAVVVPLTLIAGCAPTTNAPLVLHLATDDPEIRPAGEQIEHFADEVARLSDGAIMIAPQWQAAGDVEHAWDQANAQLVIDGDAELGLIPARAWDALGVTSLRALSSPFLIESDVHSAAVVESELVGDLMAGLPDAGVIGIDLFPEGLRHPFGFEEPVLGPDDYAGQTVRVPHSETVEEMFEALGATPVDDEPDPTVQVAAESSYSLSPAGIATGNVTFSAKINALVINAKTRQSLTDAQWQTLVEAAAATKQWVINTFLDDAIRAQTFCAEGGHIVGATDDQLAALTSATESVRDELAADPATSTLLDEIAALVPADAPVPVTSCDPAAPSSAEAGTVNGTYSVVVTEAMLADANLSAEDLAGSIGTYRTTLTDGHYDLVQTTADGDFPSAGDYTLEGDEFTWYWSHEPGQYSRMTVTIADDGSLDFDNVVDGTPTFQAVDEAIFSGWTRE